MVDKDVFFCVQIGGSMRPTLRENDILEIEPPGPVAPGPGDVIFFGPPGVSGPIIHRIEGVSEGGFRTRGDANRRADPWIVNPDDIGGLVKAVWRGRRRLKIPGGRRGRMASRRVAAKKRVRRLISALLRPLFQGAALGGFLRRFQPGRFPLRVVSFESGGGRSLYRLMLGRRQVGHYDERRGRWLVRRPFMILAGTDLPEGTTDGTDPLRIYRCPETGPGEKEPPQLIQPFSPGRAEFKSFSSR
jgi:hypothetical protein